jgi:hypothetical protein
MTSVTGSPRRSCAGGTEWAGRSRRGSWGMGFERGGLASAAGLAFAREAPASAARFARAGRFAPGPGVSRRSDALAARFAPAAGREAGLDFAAAGFGFSFAAAGSGFAGLSPARFSLRVPGRERGSRPRTPPSSFMPAQSRLRFRNHRLRGQSLCIALHPAV